MRRTNPPFFATWVLEHLTPGDRNNALSGDLLEEFRSGRSTSWYWRQVLSAVAINSAREIRSHLFVFAFAALWTIPSRAWWIFAFWSAAHSAGFILPWPYATTLGMAILVFLSLWAGLAAYVLLYSITERNSNLEGAGRGLWIGPLVFSIITVAIRPLYRPLGLSILHWEAITLFVYFLSLTASAWKIKPRAASESKAKVS